MEKIIQRLLALIKIPSISGDEVNIAKVLEMVKNEFERPGIFIREFKFEEASPILLVANCEVLDFDILTVGHLDVVPAEPKMFEPQIRDGHIFARGGLDMKASISINLSSLEYVCQTHPDLKFGVLITTDEETTSAGIKALDKHENIKAKIVLDNDAGTLMTLIEKYKHPVSVKIKATGFAAHSSRPWHGVNAINKLMETLKDLENHFVCYEKGQNRPETHWVDTMVVTAFNSPQTYNVVPASAEAWVNFRLTEKTSLEQLEKILEQCCQPHFCQYEIVLSSCGMYMDANHPIIKRYREIASEIIGQEIKVDCLNGATDSRVFAEKSVVIMQGLNGTGEHGDNENVEIDSIYKLAEIQQRFIDDYVKSH